MLYQTVRPSSLDEVVGNERTISAIRRTLRSSDRPHSFLLKGPYGVGKTTIARIMAKLVGASGLSIYEYNAANLRGIDTVRDIVAKMGISSVDGKPKVYILDESQQLTKAAQEALLKPVEDTPEDVYFIFCTTSPDNILGGIRTRCTEYELSLLGDDEILEVIDQACEKENLDVDDKIRQAVACVAGGCPRKALVDLEKVLGETDLDTVLHLVVKGTEKDSNIFQLSKLLARTPEKRRRDWRKILDVFYDIDDDPEKMRRALLTLFVQRLRNCDIEEAAEDIAFLIKCFSVNVYYGGRSQLAAQVVKACFTNKDD